MEKVVVIGAGLVGSLQAIFLAKRGYKVEVYERRSDIRQAKYIGGRSINLALSNRGWRALEAAGIASDIMKISIPMHARMMHHLDKSLVSQAYGKEGEAIYSVSRGELNRQLIICADKYENVHFHFGKKCIDVELDENILYFEDEKGNISEVKADRIIATDGAFSAIRNRILKNDRFNYSQYYLKHGYKELSIAPNADGSHKMATNYLHIWPRGEFMLIALPNLDGSFTCTLFFPFEGAKSFESLDSNEKVEKFFNEIFPDVPALMPHLKDEYAENPTSSLVTVRCEPWNYKDKILMIGDASHAIVPFYGQGMNCGFEDCTVLEHFMEKLKGDFSKVFPLFAEHRKPDADAIAELALQNFIEMRDLVADEMFLLRKKIEKKIFEKHPDKWMPLYSMVTFSEYRYSEALALGKKQDEIMNEIMAMPTITTDWDSQAVEQKIIDMLNAV